MLIICKFEILDNMICMIHDIDIVFDSFGWLLQTENFMGVLENVQATPRYREK